MFQPLVALAEGEFMDACSLVVRRWLSLIPNMLGLDCSLLVVSGSGRVCVYEIIGLPRRLDGDPSVRVNPW